MNTSTNITGAALLSLYQRLFDTYGPQNWWPADSPFEVMVGAVLTQNTSWKNVEVAVENLRQANCLDLPVFINLDIEELARLIKPSGYFNLKARRLLNLCRWLHEAGGLDSLALMETRALRESLLRVVGIGPETADDILLYALQRPVFVIDTYTRRLLSRLGLISGEENYELLRSEIEGALGEDTCLYNEFHALIVRHAKQKCSNRDGASTQLCSHCYVESVLEKHCQ